MVIAIVGVADSVTMLDVIHRIGSKLRGIVTNQADIYDFVHDNGQNCVQLNADIEFLANISDYVVVIYDDVFSYDLYYTRRHAPNRLEIDIHHHDELWLLGDKIKKRKIITKTATLF